MADQLVAALTRAVGETLEEAERRARRYSSGPFSRRELRRMGHPYARRHGRPLLDPSVINVQSGQFRGAWERTAPVVSGDRIAGKVDNTDRKAALLESGTRRMFARPLAERVSREIEPLLEQKAAAALVAALAGLLGGRST